MQKFLLLLALPLLYLALPQRAAAFVFPQGRQISTGPLTVTAGEKTYEVSAATVAQWRGVAEFSSAPLLVEKAADIEAQVKRYWGQTTPPSKKTEYLDFRPAALYAYVSSLAKELDSPAQEPRLTITNGKATEFVPPRDGILVDGYNSVVNMIEALESGQAEVSLALSTTKPQTSLAEINSLGLRELVARGTSSFKGSPKNRRHNIRVGVEKMAGIILEPGEEFSFNEHLGPVEADQGFLPELVIKRTGTVPELGGGLCQVSSTLFRSVMEAGLAIQERRNHAYAVQYYAPQGTDATIYPGVVDLRFTNDTPAPLLIWPHFVDDNTLYFDLWGTKDSRQVKLHTPQQYDRKPDGSLKASWTRDVTKNGKTTTVTFKSVYQSPALFHKEEQFVTATPTPASATPQPVVQ